MKSLPTTLALGLTTLTLTLSLIGCTDQSTTTGPETTPPPATVDIHSHPSEGPHHGDLIELGNEEYHAELIHPEHAGDEAHADGDHDHASDDEGITVYILDGTAKTEVAIDASEVTLNLTHDGQPHQFKLAALPTADNPAGQSSRFASSDKELLEHFHAETIEGNFVVTINGKSYRGPLSHDHDH